MRTLEWRGDSLSLIDQAALPGELRLLTCCTADEVGEAIRTLRVRGAPVIGVAAAYGLALAALHSTAANREELIADLRSAAEALGATRPTAVNLFWALERVVRVAELLGGDVTAIRTAVLAEADAMCLEDEERNRLIGKHGAVLVRDGANILTHCNAGALATVAYGTALGIVRAAVEQGKRVHVYADETRPVLQGARLTAWELMRDGIPVTLVADNMAGHLMKLGRVDLVIVGADRIAANGDVANKIGTYGLSVLSRAHGIPFYVAAPTSTVDLSLADGTLIPIEERSPREITHFGDIAVAPEGVAVFNPAFDVTPWDYVSAIVTENGVARAPYGEALARNVAGTSADARSEDWSKSGAVVVERG